MTKVGPNEQHPTDAETHGWTNCVAVKVGTEEAQCIARYDPRLREE
jgi:hypothetical protein